jgi:hypothetical protein
MAKAQGALGLAKLASIGAIVALGLAPGCEDVPLAEQPGADEHGEIGLARSLCEASCARGIRCDGPRGSSCDCGAVRDSNLLRPDWARAELACLGRTPCSSSTAAADCETEAYRAIGIAPLSWPTVVMRCLERGDACGGSFVTCRHLAAMSDDATAAASVCFDQPCDAYAACFRDFLASRVTPAVPAWR